MRKARPRADMRASGRERASRRVEHASESIWTDGGFATTISTDCDAPEDPAPP
jgi:hypothetical protein